MVIEDTDDPGLLHQGIAHLSGLFSVWVKERKRRSRPAQHSNIDALSNIGQQLAQPLATLAQLELRREEPAGEMHVRLRLLDLVGDPRQRCRAVDQDLEPIPVPRRRIGVGEPSCGRVKSPKPSDPSEPPPMMRDDDLLDNPTR